MPARVGWWGMQAKPTRLSKLGCDAKSESHLQLMLVIRTLSWYQYQDSAEKKVSRLRTTSILGLSRCSGIYSQHLKQMQNSESDLDFGHQIGARQVHKEQWAHVPNNSWTNHSMRQHVQCACVPNNSKTKARSLGFLVLEISSGYYPPSCCLGLLDSL